MGYIIQYGNTANKNAKRKKYFDFRILFLLGLFVLVALILFFPDLTAQIRQYIFPFFEPPVQEAFAEMMSDIKAGISVSEAAIEFCKEIVYKTSY